MIFLSNLMLFITFFMYIFASIIFFVAVAGKKWRGRDPESHSMRWGEYGYWLAAIGFIAQLLFIILRWIIGGHAPTSNMFEFTTFLAFSVMVAFLIIYRIYRLPILGIFVMPLSIILIAYAWVFPSKITPLIPALQSYWLHIHVTLAALGEGAFAIGFAAGLMYLLQNVDQTKSSKETRLLEFTIWTVLVLIAFILLSFLFRGIGFTEEFKTINQNGKEEIVEYSMPSIVGPFGGEKLTQNGFGPFFETPSWMKGVDAGNKFNSMLWSVLGGIVLYVLIRLIARKRLAAVLRTWLTDVDSETVDEISYRAIAIGFPIFTLGALVFAMIWAAEAWGRFWGWDPKEVWALITWLYYSVYLHVRLSIGWQGKKSAWMAVLGFIVVMFTLIGVNFLIAGLHAYA